MGTVSKRRTARKRRDRPLHREEKVRLALVALPTLALAFAITIVSTYPSEVTRRYTCGFQAMWIVCAAGAFLSIPFVHRLRAAIRDRD